MPDERHKEHNLPWLKIGNTVLTRCFPFTKLLIWQIALLAEFLEVLWLRAWRRSDLGADGHLWHLQRPLLDSLLGSGARVLALTL